MADIRIVATAEKSGWLGLGSIFTTQVDDQQLEGMWSRPEAPLIIFSDHTLAGTTMSHHGGAIGGALAGHPLQLVFWGDWWTTAAGQPRRALIEARTKALLDSPYFSLLGQYGIARAPVWGGSTIVTYPGPPLFSPSLKSIGRSIVGLVDDLIDDDVFPDPDDGPRMLFVVLMPDGWVLQSADALGGHRKSYDFDFPFDSDRYWAGFVEPRPADPESTMWILSHEVVEMLTDPEQDGWHTEVSSLVNEMSDAGFSGNYATPQTAFVNGVQVQSYWSNLHGKTVIPVVPNHAARLRARITGSARRILDSGTFRPPASDSIACSSELPQCCMEDRDYTWRVYGYDERARIRLQTEGYRTPAATWRINGTVVTGSGSLPLTVDLETFAGRTAKVTPTPITIQYVATPSGLDITTSAVGGNFELFVGCEVRDGSITGSVLAEPVATPHIAVGFVGARVLLEKAYIDQRSACLSAMIKRYDVQYKPTGKPRPDDGLKYQPGILLNDQPAYVRPSRYRELRWIEKAIRAAHALLPAAQARRLTRALAAEAPALSSNVRVTGPGATRRRAARPRYETVQAGDLPARPGR